MIVSDTKTPGAAGAHFLMEASSLPRVAGGRPETNYVLGNIHLKLVHP